MTNYNTDTTKNAINLECMNDMTPAQQEQLTAQLNWIDANIPAGSQLIYVYIAGSYAHGLFNENSDIDMRAVIIEPAENILKQYEQPVIRNADIDCTIYSLKKHFEMILKGGQVSMESLRMPHECILLKEPIIDELAANRTVYYTKRNIKTCLKTAENQITKQTLRKIKNIDDENELKNAVRHVSKATAEGIRLINVADYIMTNNEFPSHLPDENLLDNLDKIRNGSYAEINTKAKTVGMNAELLQYAKQLMGTVNDRLQSYTDLPDNTTDEAKAFSDSILIKANMMSIANSDYMLTVH